MASIARITALWTGTTVVGGGVSTFYSSNLSPGGFCTALRTYFVTTGGSIASGTTITIQPTGDLIDENTGALTGAWSTTPPAAVICSGSANWASGVGTRQVWNTAGITRRRRVKGSTFLVPLGGNLYDGTGSIADATVAILQGAGATLLAADSGSMRIWSRPSGAGASDGAAHAVLSCSTPDRVSWLRSRRT